MNSPELRRRTLDLVAVAALTLGPILFLVAEAITANAWNDPTYSYPRNWISDLGVPDPGVFQGRQIDSPLHTVMNSGFVFGGIALAVGVLLTAGTLTGATRRTAQILAVTTAAGYILVGTTHTSQAAAANGTIILHFTGAALSIIGGNVLAIVLGRYWWERPDTRGLGHFIAPVGIIGLTAVVVLGATAADPDAPNGLIERISVYTVLLWQLRLALHLLGPHSRTLT